jgi:type I site-specific restriction-modification system R (restriction) subunit
MASSHAADAKKSRHFSFNAEERFLPVYQFAGEDNTHLDSFAERFLAKCTLAQMISRYMVLVARLRRRSGIIPIASCWPATSPIIWPQLN